MISERYIFSLLTNEHDWDNIIHRLEWLGRRKAEGLEGHHIEPEREMIIYLKPLEHLAIHVAHARKNPTASNRSKVCAFVRLFPGSYRRMLDVSNELKSALISYGQGGRNTHLIMNAHPNTDKARKAPKPYAAENGRKGAEKTRGKPRSIPITWGSKISDAANAEPIFICEHCGKKVKRKANLIQHQRSSKCTRNTLT